MAAFSEDRAKEIIAKELEVDAKQLTPEAKFIEDLGADSLDTVELVMALEEEFGLDIPDEDADKFKTVGDAHELPEGARDSVLNDGRTESRTPHAPRSHGGRRGTASHRERSSERETERQRVVVTGIGRRLPARQRRSRRSGQAWSPASAAPDRSRASIRPATRRASRAR